MSDEMTDPFEDHDNADSQVDDGAEGGGSDEGADASASSGGGDFGDSAEAAADSLEMSSTTKLCVYCISEIDSMATRCNRCSGYLPPAEGTDFKQHWTMLFCCVAIFTACIWLPIEGSRNDLYASHSIAGGFLTIFAAYGIFASWANLFHRKMIMWPALFMAFDGLYVTVRRLVEAVTGMPDGATKDDWVRLAGPGLWVILFCSLMVVFTLFSGAASGRKKEKARREAMRAQKRR